MRGIAKVNYGCKFCGKKTDGSAYCAECMKRYPSKVPVKDSHVTDSRRARLHRALDCVLDRSVAASGKDARGLPYDHPRIQKLESEIRRLEDKGIPYDDPRVKKLEAEIRRLEGI